MSITTIGNGETEDVRKIVGKLRANLESYDHNRAQRAGWRRRFIPTGLAPLDAVLPHGGLPCGAVIEILSEGAGVGAMSLAMRIAAQCYPEPQALACANSPQVEESWTLENARGLKPAAQGGESHHAGNGVGKPRARAWGSDKHSGTWGSDKYCILLDALGDFYPPAAWQHGIALDRLIVLRTRNARDAFWAVDQSLRCFAVAAVIAPFTRLDQRLSRRLQLAAQSSGCIGLILRPAEQRVKSFAAVQMLLEGLPASPASPLCSQVYTESPRENTHCAQRCTTAPLRSRLGMAMPNLARSVGDPYLCRITLLAVREGTPAEPVWVDLHDEAGIGPVHPVPVDRSAAKIA